jgi:plastocyanin
MMIRARRSLVVAGVGLAALFAAAPFAAAAETATTTPTTAVRLPAPPTTTTTTATTTTAPTTTTTTAALHDPFTPVPAPAPGAAATAAVSIVDFGFTPASLTVAAGTTVTWTNTGAVIHSVTSDTGAFDSSPSCPGGACINPGSSYSHVFAQAGTFAYHCKVHPNMHGTVIVNAAAPTPTTTASTVPGGNGNPPVTTGGSGSTVAPGGAGAELAFTGTSSVVAWLALGALAAIALGLALRPRRRPFPDPR